MAKTQKKNGGGAARSEYYVVSKAAPGNGNFFGVIGDAGALIDALKLYNVPPSKRDQLERTYLQRVTSPVTPSECRCGVKFLSEELRAAHIQKRHLARPNSVKDFNECTEREREAILRGVGEPGLSPRDPEYYASQYDFHVPDPEDRQVAAEDRRLQDQIDWTKTAASQRG